MARVCGESVGAEADEARGRSGGAGGREPRSMLAIVSFGYLVRPARRAYRVNFDGQFFREAPMGWFVRERETAPCTVEVSHRFDSLHAHLRLDNGAVIHPGDEVLVHGPEIMAPYGEVVVESRTATITRATPLQRLWTRLTGDLEFMELCEFSFSEEVMPS